MSLEENNYRWLAFDESKNKTLLSIKKISHSDAEYDDEPYLEGNILYITSQTPQIIDVNKLPYCLPRPLEDGMVNILDIYAANIVFSPYECEVRFLTLEESVAIGYQDALRKGMASPAQTFSIALDNCIEIQAIILGDDAYGQEGCFDVLASPKANERLTHCSESYFGDSGARCIPVTNVHLLAQHYPYHFEQTKNNTITREQ